MTEQTKEAIVAAGEIANWARIELVKYKEAIEELKVCISKLPIEANYFGNVDRMKYIINKL